MSKTTDDDLRALLAEALPLLRAALEPTLRAGQRNHWCLRCEARAPLAEPLAHRAGCPHGVLQRLEQAIPRSSSAAR